MKVAIHQPEYLPWLGFFHKMTNCDLYVLLDNVQFTKNNYQNRNRLIDRDGNVYWSTIPVRMLGHTKRTIAEMEIDDTQPWRRKCWDRIVASYLRYPYFDALAPQIEEIFGRKHLKLVNINIALIEFFCKQLDIHTPILQATSLGVSGVRSELLLSICQAVGASCYLSGPSGRDYLDTDLFARSGISIEYHEFSHPEYRAPIFVPYLSTLDLLMNHGPDSRSILGLKS